MCRYLLIIGCLIGFQVFADTQNHKALVQKAQAALYVLGYDVPPEDWVTVSSEIKKYHSMLLTEKKQLVDYEKIDKLFLDNEDFLINQYMKLSSTSKHFCKSDITAAKCLTFAEDNTDVVSRHLATLTRVWQQVDILKEASKIRIAIEGGAFNSMLPDSLMLINGSLPNYAFLIHPLKTKNAITFTQNPEKGVLQTCSSISLGKALVGSSDSLIQSMIGVAVVKEHLNLLSAMLEKEKIINLREVCGAHLSALSEKSISMCRLGDSEKRYQIGIIKLIKNSSTFDKQKSIDLLEKYWHSYCQSEWQNQLLNDRPAKTMKPKAIELYCEGNSDFCNDFSQQNSQITAYQNRLQDMNALLKLWQQSLTRGCDAALAKTWSPEREFTIIGQTLQIKTYNDSRDEMFSVPCMKN